MLTTALIFAAGRGERLRPYTLYQPKPMLEIGNKPLLRFHLEKLAEAGFQRVIINHAYLGYQIKHYFGRGEGLNLSIDYFAEPPGGLETGGTLAAIAKGCHIDNEYLLAINGDIYTDFEYSTTFAMPEEFKAKLILVSAQENFKTKDFGMDKHVIHLQEKNYIFSGIAYYRLAPLKNLKVGRYSIREWLFSQAKKSGLQGEIYNGLWFDVGTKERLLALRKLKG